MWNVNFTNANGEKEADFSFLLTMWNVNREYKAALEKAKQFSINYVECKLNFRAKVDAHDERFSINYVECKFFVFVQ